MAHQSEIENPLSVESHVLGGIDELERVGSEAGDVFLISLPFSPDSVLAGTEEAVRLIRSYCQDLPDSTVASFLCTPEIAALLCNALADDLRYQLWIATKLTSPVTADGILPMHHAALLVFTKDDIPLKHTYTRIGYSYCPACDKTTKDYGGKKHTYHSFGTLMSDVWRDISVDPHGKLQSIESRLSDLFSLPPYKRFVSLDLRSIPSKPSVHVAEKPAITRSDREQSSESRHNSQLLTGDSMEIMRDLPDSSIDFCFADPPYNLGKTYNSWHDSLEIEEYFHWCDQWLYEMLRVLKPGRTFAVLNIPLWAARHFSYLDSIAVFQNWIAWEGLSLPVRKIMPAHYSIVCFSKGRPRTLPGLDGSKSAREAAALNSAAEFFCSRASCRKARLGVHNDYAATTDLWWDIFRLKHNSRRVDHPCQLPPLLMERLISLYTYAGEHVLDPFNGVGTTTLSAEQLGRSFTGIEIDPKYRQIALDRHEELRSGIDPFRKRSTTPKAKNSRVKRLKKQKYAVTKKALQLEVKRIANILGRLPTKDEIREQAKYSYHFYEDYFIDWGEAYAAARTTGMSETRGSTATHPPEHQQLSLLD
ncbi:DNA methyltransferase [Candidatus Bipolaricaulota bacterium]